jgi:hypothetical protein
MIDLKKTNCNDIFPNSKNCIGLDPNNFFLRMYPCKMSELVCDSLFLTFAIIRNRVS